MESPTIMMRGVVTLGGKTELPVVADPVTLAALVVAPVEVAPPAPVWALLPVLPVPALVLVLALVSEPAVVVLVTLPEALLLAAVPVTWVLLVAPVVLLAAVVEAELAVVPVAVLVLVSPAVSLFELGAGSEDEHEMLVVHTKAKATSEPGRPNSDRSKVSMVARALPGALPVTSALPHKGGRHARSFGLEARGDVSARKLRHEAACPAPSLIGAKC